MNLKIAGQTVSLSRRQTELVWKEWECLRLEEQAARMLERFSAGRYDVLLSLWTDACRDRNHPDYICDVLAQRFQQHRSDEVADVDTWYCVIREELELRRDALADIDDVFGGWLQRPLENLVRMCWRNSSGDFSVTFSLDRVLTDAPTSLLTLTICREPEGILRVKLHDACSASTSDMQYFPDGDGQPQCDFDELEASIREYLEVYAQMRDEPMPGSLWIRQF